MSAGAGPLGQALPTSAFAQKKGDFSFLPSHTVPLVPPMRCPPLLPVSGTRLQHPQHRCSQHPKSLRPWVLCRSPQPRGEQGIYPPSPRCSDVITESEHLPQPSRAAAARRRKQEGQEEKRGGFLQFCSISSPGEGPEGSNKGLIDPAQGHRSPPAAAGPLRDTDVKE